MAALPQTYTLTREDEYYELKKELHGIGERRRNDGKRIIEILWEIYSKQFYVTEEGFEGPMAWRQYCDDVIAPYFDNDPYFNDFPAIMDSVLDFVRRREVSAEPVLHPVTHQPITAEQLISRPGMVGKLITASQKAGFCKEDEQKVSLIQTVVTGTREDVARRGERIQREITPITIDYTIQVNADGTVTYIFRNLSNDASKLFNRVLEHSLGKAALELKLI